MVAAAPMVLSEKAQGKQKEVEKRITRSAQVLDEVEVFNATPYLPFNTRIILSSIRGEGYTSILPDIIPDPAERILIKPSFRLLSIGESFTKSRNLISTVDTSDSQYFKLHRYPDLLEKRSAKAEREALIHQRSKLIIEIEELKSRGWIYQQGQGGKSEQERLKKLNQLEERLKRYDALLPGQPRKAGFLNSKPSSSHANTSANNSRSNSPSISSNSHSNHLQSTRHHSKPISATSNGSTTIKIVFRGSSNSKGKGKGNSGARSKRGYHDTDTESEPEGAYFDETPRKRIKSKLSIRSNKMMEQDSSSSPSSPSSSESSSESTAPVKKKKSSNPDYLIHTFHSSSSLQLTLAPTNSKSKARRSSRIAYAFGHKLPDLALMKTSDFGLIGGIEDATEKPLEDYCRDREGCGGISMEAPGRGFIDVSGVKVPMSSLFQD